MNFIKAYNTLFFLFGMSLLTSMAGMEFFSSLILVTSLAFAIKNKPNFSFLGKELYIFLSLLTVCILSLAINGHQQDIPHTLGWFRWIIIFYGLYFSLTQSPNGALYLVKGLLTGGALSVINAFTQSITHKDWARGNRIIPYYADLDKTITRVTGFFNMPTTYGYILALFLFIPLTLFFITKKKPQKIILAIIFFLGIIGLAITYSRGAWLCFAGGLFIFVALKNAKMLLPIGALSLMVGLPFYNYTSGFNERVGSIADSEYYSNSQRIELWNANWAIFKDHPMLGAGFNANDQLVVKYHKNLNHKESYQSHAHNSYLQYLAGTGFIGFIIFLSLFSFFFIKNLRSLLKSNGNEKTIYIGLISIQAAFIACCLFDCNFGDSEVRYSYLTYIALFSALSYKKP